VSEWLKEHAWKACIRVKPYRGFESLSLRQFSACYICHLLEKTGRVSKVMTCVGQLLAVPGCVGCDTCYCMQAV
jgi:hypothetical protein